MFDTCFCLFSFGHFIRIPEIFSGNGGKEVDWEVKPTVYGRVSQAVGLRGYLEGVLKYGLI